MEANLSAVLNRDYCSWQYCISFGDIPRQSDEDDEHASQCQTAIKKLNSDERLSTTVTGTVLFIQGTSLMSYDDKSRVAVTLVFRSKALALLLLKAYNIFFCWGFQFTRRAYIPTQESREPKTNSTTIKLIDPPQTSQLTTQHKINIKEKATTKSPRPKLTYYNLFDAYK